MRSHMVLRLSMLVVAVALAGSFVGLDAQQGRTTVAIDPDDIGGVVTSPNGPEAGVWVVAETTDFPTRLIKIVTTDDGGRYVLPDLPPASFQVFVRGYGLVDSPPVEARPGSLLNLTAVVASDPHEAAKVYPASSWLSLIRFPGGDVSPFEVNRVIKICVACHQLGDAFTREIADYVGPYDSHVDAWDRRIGLGLSAGNMRRLFGQLGPQRTMFAEWTDRIAAGELPPAPRRPTGLDRNVVTTLWDWGGPMDYVHDVTPSDRRNPTVNAHGKVYGPAQSRDKLVWVDPVANTAGEIDIPSTAPVRGGEQSRFWDDETIRASAVDPRSAVMDDKGRVYVAARLYGEEDRPDFCNPELNPDNKFIQHFPIQRTFGGKQVAMYDPKTDEITGLDACFYTDHNHFSDDGSLFFGQYADTVGWLNVDVYDETQDVEAAQGWCPAVVDANGDGQITPGWTEPDEPIDPTKDHRIQFNCYSIGVTHDGTAWCAPGGEHGNRIVRVERGSNPPASCNAEVYEAPPNWPGSPGIRGIDVDTNGVAWVNLVVADAIGSFDRRRCATLNGPAAATGQHCPEGWTFYPIPGPTMQGTPYKAESTYLMTIDRQDVLGLGKNTPIAYADNSDSMLALRPVTGEWVRLRIPYPLGFLGRVIDPRIDDAEAGWKGRGMWSNYSQLAVWHIEGAKGTNGKLVKLQLRPHPLAK